ncbi:c-type cytochrome [Amphritea sp. HPY]|uniref:c-type cytochrome n=1 Tax=Amphritea sp. HPY TaxID=3421652 RepID=UPI003D7DDD41
MLKATSLKGLTKKYGAILLLIAPFGISDAAAKEDLAGFDEFRASCASCHGIDGKGRGPLRKHLTIKPADLTVLAKNNNGQYPFKKVMETIDGRAGVSVHGESAMPVWGQRYREEAGLEIHFVDYERVIRGRILELVYYIQKIQEK